jgi:hypothetical protein
MAKAGGLEHAAKPLIPVLLLKDEGNALGRKPAPVPRPSLSLLLGIVVGLLLARRLSGFPGGVAHGSPMALETVLRVNSRSFGCAQWFSFRCVCLCICKRQWSFAAF